MKRSIVLFVGSLGLNAVLLGVYVVRRADNLLAAGGRTSSGRTAVAAELTPNAARRDSPEVRGTATKATMAATSLWAALDSSDLPTLIARLRAAGFPANIVGEIVSARVDALFAARLKEIAGTPANQPYWKTERLGGFGSQYYEAMSQLYRDRSKMLREVLADPFFADAPLGALELERRRQFGGLPKDKADAIQRIADDYTEMAAKVRAGTGGILLPEDREQLALLEREKRADLATILTPQELAEYEMRTSPVTSRLRAALTLMGATEEEFRAIYAVQQPYGEMLYPTGSGVMVQGARRLELEGQIAEQLKAALGEERYADYARSSDREFQQLNQIAQRENVSGEAALQAYNLREPVARESNRIFDDPGMTVEQKRAALLALAQSTKTQLRNTLGPAASDAYIRTANWVNGLESGRVTKFSPGGINSMRGLPPAGKPSP